MIEAAITAAISVTLGMICIVLVFFTLYCLDRIILKDHHYYLIFLFIGWWVFITALIYISKNTL